MELKDDLTLPALKFFTLDSEHICRLCLASTEDEEVSLDDSVNIQKSYIDETVTFADMFNRLGVPLEWSLPHLLCVNCATITTNSYLFTELCRHSNKVWNAALDRLNTSLHQSDTISPNAQSIFMIIKDDNVLVGSKNNCSTKKQALTKLKVCMKPKLSSKKIKNLKSKIICEECGEGFPSKSFLVKHMRVHTSSRHPCPQCPKVFNSKLKVDDHAERVHFPKKLLCPICSKMFSTTRLLKNHNKLHHVASICKLCFIQFPSKKDLNAHLDKHDLKKCPRCTKSFTNKHTYKFHLKICGNSENSQPSFFCDICGKGYVRKNGIRTHIKIDHGFGSVLSCNWCGKKFDAISRLRNHAVKHTKERNFHCEHCGGKFVTQAALVYHTRLHTGERPFPCDLCNESFLSASRRMEHKHRKHFGPTKECHVCHVKFVTRHQLKKHVERHYNPHSKLFVAESEEPYLVYDNIDGATLKEQTFPVISKLLTI